MKLFSDQLKKFIYNSTLSIPSLIPHSAILSHMDLSNDYLLINHLILIFKFYIYNSRNIEHLIPIIDKTRSVEKEMSKNEPKKIQVS